VTAAVVGVIGSLALWFAGHLLFEQFDSGRPADLPFDLPVWTSFDLRAALLALLSAGLLFGLKWGVVRVLVAAALGGLALAQF